MSDHDGLELVITILWNAQLPEVLYLSANHFSICRSIELVMGGAGQTTSVACRSSHEEARLGCCETGEEP
ncbi:hypothetical protein FBZ93_12220 [Bradyrhizobium macuxiense]|uniref:Uncharacterized protein n=1 Tax=Bradyrhizobium macuxiense TaxID=1755647 RepID=A0A560KVW6_9BRAD|nr:hypothetical protein [Bradyrhizobium macuxiense]TWB87239.1 hypothetical protein FBZ93_12220 [Bradyrhizobium macuxiense]